MTQDSAIRLRVVELAEGVAGPVCGRQFAALGHDVVKVERPAGDRQRRAAPLAAAGPDAERSLSFQYLNLGKRSVVADLETAAGRERVLDLVAGADVVVTDLLPAEAQRLGLTADDFATRAPGIVVVSVTAFGLTGELADVPGDSLLAEAYGGLVAMVGEPGRAPLMLGGRQGEYSAGIAGFFAALVALGRPAPSSGARLADVAACDIAAYMDWKSEASVRASGALPTRTGASGRWKILEAADGLVGLVYQPFQWQLIVDLIGAPELADERFATQQGRDEHEAEWVPIVQAWAAALPKAEIYALGQKVGLPFGYLATIADAAQSPQLAARGFLQTVEHPDLGPLVFPAGPIPQAALPWSMAPAPRLGEHTAAAGGSGGAGRRELGGDARAPLAGITVLDLGTITAGAATSRLLADLGARVIKIEARNAPDRLRFWGADAGPDTATSPFFPPNNAGKEGVSLNLKTERGRELFAQMARSADVLVENYAAGVTGRLGIAFADIHAINPALVYASLSSHGQDGPGSREKSYGSTLDLLSGFASVSGYPDMPLWSSFDVNYADQLVSLYAAALVVHALEVGPRGVHLDMAQLEVVAQTLGELFAAEAATGTTYGPKGNARAYAEPHDVYPSAGSDRWVALSCETDEQRSALAGVIGIDLAAAGADAWRARRDELGAEIAAWTAGRDRVDAAAELRAAGVPAVPVMTADARHADARFTDRGVYTAGPDAGELAKVKGLPFLVDGFAPVSGTRAPELGEDTLGVLAELCGVDEAELAELREADVV